MESEYWVLNRLRRSRNQTWNVFCAEFIPYGVSFATVYYAATGKQHPQERTQDKLDRYLADHADEIASLS